MLRTFSTSHGKLSFRKYEVEWGRGVKERGKDFVGLTREKFTVFNSDTMENELY